MGAMKDFYIDQVENQVRQSGEFASNDDFHDAVDAEFERIDHMSSDEFSAYVAKFDTAPKVLAVSTKSVRIFADMAGMLAGLDDMARNAELVARTIERPPVTDYEANWRAHAMCGHQDYRGYYVIKTLDETGDKRDPEVLRYFAGGGSYSQALELAQQTRFTGQGWAVIGSHYTCGHVIW